jgi:hypothetical protein
MAVAEVHKVMSKQAREIKNEAIPQWAEGLYYNKGLFSEALYVEYRGKDSGIVRFSFEMLETLDEVVEEIEEERPESLGQNEQA